MIFLLPAEQMDLLWDAVTNPLFLCWYKKKKDNYFGFRVSEMLYGNLSEKKAKFFLSFKEYGQAVYATISLYNLLRRMRWSPGLNRTHVHPEEERLNRKLQTCSSSETQHAGNIKAWFFWAFWYLITWLPADSIKKIWNICSSFFYPREYDFKPVIRQQQHSAGQCFLGMKKDQVLTVIF